MALQVGKLYAEMAVDISNFMSSIRDVQSSLTGVASRASGMESDIRSAMSGSSQATDRLTDSLDDVQQKAKEAGNETATQAQTMQDRLNEVADATQEVAIAIGALVGSAVLLGGLGVKSADDLDSALKRLQFQSGATNEEMQAHKTVLEDIYKMNLGESYEDVADSMSSVMTATGLTGDALTKATSQALQLSKYMEFDVAESTRAVGIMMRNFGISSDEAFQLIAQGTQKGANMSGDFLDTLSEYSVQFKSVGKSAEEMVEILIQGSQAGAFNLDKVADAVKENNIRLTDGSKASRDALTELGYDFNAIEEAVASGGEAGSMAVSEVATSLLNMQDKSRQAQLAVSLFGTQFEDLKMVALTSMVDVKDSIDMSKNAFDSLKNPEYSTFSSALAEMGRLIKTEILVPLGEELKPILFDMISWFRDNMPAIQALVSGTGDVIAMVFGGLWTIAKPIFTAISEIIIFTVKNMSWLIPSLKAVATMLTVVALGIGAYTVAVNVARMATILWNAVMAMNPIFLIGMAIAGAVVALGELTDWFGLAGSEADSAGQDIESAMAEAESSVYDISDAMDTAFQDRDMTLTVDGEMGDMDVTEVTPTRVDVTGKMKYIDASEGVVNTVDANGNQVVIPLSEYNKGKGFTIVEDKPKETSKPIMKGQAGSGNPLPQGYGNQMSADEFKKQFLEGSTSNVTKISDKEVEALSNWLINREAEIKNAEKKKQEQKDSIKSIFSGVGDAVDEVTGKKGSTGGATRQESAQKKAYDAGIKFIENQKHFKKLSMQQEYDAYVRVQQKMNKKTQEGADLWMELEKKKFTLAEQMKEKKRQAEEEKKRQDSAQKKQFDATVSYIQRETEMRRMSAQQAFSTYEKAQSRLNLKTAEGVRLWEEAEKKKFSIASDISSKMVSLAQSRMSRMAKLSSDPARTEISEMEKLLKSDKLTSEDRRKVSESLWDKKVEYAIDASKKILSQTLSDIEKAKDADLKAIQSTFDARRKAVEDRFRQEDTQIKRQERQRELAQLRQDEALYMGATSKAGVEKLRSIQEAIADILSQEQADARESLKEQMLASIDDEEARAIKKAEARAEALTADAEKKSKQIQQTLVDVATKTTGTLDSLVDKIQSYGGTMYKAGSDIVKQFGLGMSQFSPELKQFSVILDKIEKATSMGQIDTLTASGRDIIKSANQRMANPMTSVGTNKSVTINAPLINIASVTIKDKTDAVAFAKEQQRLLEVASRSIGR